MDMNVVTAAVILWLDLDISMTVRHTEPLKPQLPSYSVIIAHCSLPLTWVLKKNRVICYCLRTICLCCHSVAPCVPSLNAFPLQKLFDWQDCRQEIIIELVVAFATFDDKLLANFWWNDCRLQVRHFTLFNSFLWFIFSPSVPVVPLPTERFNNSVNYQFNFSSCLLFLAGFFSLNFSISPGNLKCQSHR